MEFRLHLGVNGKVLKGLQRGNDLSFREKFFDQQWVMRRDREQILGVTKYTVQPEQHPFLLGTKRRRRHVIAMAVLITSYSFY